MGKRTWAALGASLAMVAAAFGVEGQENESGNQGTGLAPADPAAYAGYKAVGRHRAFLPPSVDLTANFPTPGDQEWQGACSAWSVGYAARSFLTGRQTGDKPDAKSEIASPAYIYHRIRKRKESCTDPASIADALNLLVDEGAVSLEDMAYGTMLCRNAPTPDLITKAASLRIGGWRAIQHEVADDWRSPIVMDDVKGQLAAGLPVVFAMTVTSEFRAWKSDAVYNTASPAGAGHAMALVGYDEGRQAFRAMNSWGPYWGDHGFIWIGYDTFRTLVREAYVLEPPGAEPPPAVAAPTPTLEQAVGKLECGKAQVVQRGGRTVVEGFGGSAASIGEAQKLALAADPRVQWNVVNHPWPQCEAELTLDAPLKDSGPKVSVAAAQGGLLSGDPVVLRKDDFFSVQVETSGARPFVHVIYLQADGSAVEIYRGTPDRDRSGKRIVKLGASGRTQDRYQVQGPYGDEMVVVVASDAPLFTTELAGQRTERQFLTLLRSRVVSAQKAGRPVSAAVQRIRTVAG